MPETLKLQPAIDFLASYGLAIAVMGVALAAVVAIALRPPQTVSCVSPPGFNCGYISINASGALVVKISQALGSPIVINGVACSSQQASGGGPLYGNTKVGSLSEYYPANLFVPGGTMYSGTSAIMAAYCYSGPDTKASGGIGTTFSGYLWINYTLPGYGSYVEEAAAFTAPFVRGSLTTYTTTSSVSSSSTSTSSTSTSTTSILTTTANTLQTVYVPITITNSQPSATPAGFQEMLTVPSSSYSSYISPAWTNVEFTTGAAATGSVIPAWVESGNTNTASSTIVWVKLPASIPANGNTVIYMDFMATNVMSSSGPTGEAPQLSPTYAEYDNGASVFSDYWNFPGPALPSGWADANAVGYTVSNGLYVTGGSAYGATDFLFQSNVLEAYLEWPYTEVSSGGSSGIDDADAAGWLGGAGNLIYFHALPLGGGSTNVYTYAANGPTSYGIDGGIGVFNYVPGTYYVLSTFSNSIATGWLENYLQVYSAAGSVNSYSRYVILGDYFTGSTEPTTPIMYKWARVRAYPPGGIMPSASFGGIDTYTTLTVAQPAASPSSVQQGQTANIVDSGASGGSAPYTYQWYVETPGSGSYIAATSTYCSSPTSTTCSFATNSVTTTGTYSFKLQAKDSLSETANSLAASVTVTAAAIVHYAAVTLTNSQTYTVPYVPVTLDAASAMTGPFQQEIPVDSAAYNSLINSAWSNVEFTTGPAATGTVLKAWVQSNASNSASNTLVWVAFPSGLASGSTTVYMDFMPTNVMSSSGPTGEAPQLSPTYAEYDNGANVFNFYDNFAGSALDSKWGSAVANSGGSISVNNGATFTTSTTMSYVFLPAASSIAYPQITEMLFDPSNTATAEISATIGETEGTTASSWVDLCQGAEFDWNIRTTSTYLVTSASCTSVIATSVTLPNSINSNSIVGFAWTSPDLYLYINGTQLTSQSTSGSGLTIANYMPYLGISNSYTGSFSVQWVRARTYPAGGAMPTVSFGTLVFASAMPSTFQQELSVPTGSYSPYINSAWSNVEFTTGPSATGSVLQAWVQSGASNTVANTFVWVKLPYNFTGTNTIYMDFMATNVMSSSGPTGEAPQLSPTYAEYDNGANVFNFYDNFAGSALDSKWGSAVANSGGSISVNNGATLTTTATSSYVFLPAASSIAYPQITEMLFNSKFIATNGISPVIGETEGTTASTWVDLCPGAELSWVPGITTETFIVTTPSCSSYGKAPYTYTAASNSIVGFSWTLPYYYSYVNGTQMASRGTSGSGLTIGNYKPYLGITNIGIGSYYVSWVRARAMPPSGVMPSASYGTVS